MQHNIWGPWAMRQADFLRMTPLLATVFATIVHPAARFTTVEHSYPLIGIIFRTKACHPNHTLFLITSFAADDRLLHLSAVAASIHRSLASTTKPFVTFPLTGMLAARHKIIANLSTTPARIIIRIHATLADRLLTAEATLYGSHMGTRWAGPGVAKELTRMRALLRQNTRLPARLTARMRRNPGYRSRIYLFPAPAGVH